VRYFLLREIPPTEDGDFTYEKFEERYNSDLASGIGNLVSRILTVAAKSNPKSQIPNPKFQKEIEKTWRNWRKSLEEFKFNEALISIWDLISFCDRYIEKERPWELLKLKIKNEKLKIVISNLLFALENIAKLLQPFLPETSEKIFQQLKTKKSKILFPRLK
jgi:methionyl-tRNA synthetase